MQQLAALIAQEREAIARAWVDSLLSHGKNNKTEPCVAYAEALAFLDNLAKKLPTVAAAQISESLFLSAISGERLILHDVILQYADCAAMDVTLRDSRQLRDTIASLRRKRIRLADDALLHEAKEHAEQQLAIASRIAKLGFFSLNVETGILELNAQMQLDWQLPSPTTLDAALARLHPDDRDRVAGLVNDSIFARKPYETEYRVVLPGGTSMVIEAHGTVTYDARSKPLRFFGTVRNVSAQVGQRQWLQRVLDELPMPLVMVEPDTGSHVFSNRAADEMYGSTIPKLTDPATYGEYFHITDSAGHRLGAADVPSTRAARGEVVDKEEYSWHTPRGRFDLVVSARHLPAMYGQDAMVLFAFQDVTAVKTTQQDLRAAVVRLEDEATLREHFVSALSHDLRTPLAAASLAAQSLARHVNSPERLDKSVQRIMTSLGRVESMIRDILDANRLKAGTPLELNQEACQLHALLRDAVADLQQLHGERITLKTPCACVTGAFDGDALRRIVDNLVSNAVKYGDEVSPIEVSLGATEKTVTIAVHNQGKPIAAEDQKTLFEPYYRAASARQSKHKGWGIGLALVREISQAHGGSVDVCSCAATGTTFTVRLPIRG